jgi:hypothetical protein
VSRFNFPCCGPIKINLFQRAVDAVDSVLIHHGGATVIRFKNSSKTPDEDSCSLFLAITEIRIRAAAIPERVKVATFDWLVPVLVGGLVAIAGMAIFGSCRP